MAQHISIQPHPQLVRTALDHSGLPSDWYTDDGPVIPSGPGWDSNGNMTVPEDHILHPLLSGVLTLAMEKHLDDTMILPSNVSRIRDVSRQLFELSSYVGSDETAEHLQELVDILDGIANNLDPATRNR